MGRSSRLSRFRRLLLMAALSGAGAVGAQEPGLTVAIAPDRVGLGQQTIFQVRVEVAAMRLLRVQPTFELHNLEVVAGPFQEQSMQFVNGAISNTTTLRWRLRPTAVGDARIHNIRVEVGDATLTAEPLTVEVQEEPVPEAEPPARRTDPLDEFFRRGDPFRRRAAAKPELHLRVETNPGDPFVGEPVHYTLYLFTRNDVTSVNAEMLPDFEGFWKEEPSSDSEPKNAQTVTIDGRKWLRVALLERVLYPLRSGELTIDPATMAFAVDVDSSGFFRDRRSVQRTSPAATLTVRPLPPGGPGPGTPVGQVRVTSSLQPSRVEVGEAAQLEVVVTGGGNLRRLPDPEVAAPEGVEIYPPQGEIDRRFVSGGVEFTRKWSWVVVPREAGSYQLPAMEIPYFDLQSEAFASTTTAAATLAVTPATTVPSDAWIGERSSLHPVRTAPVAALESRQPSRWGTWLLVAGAVVAVVVGVSDLRTDRRSRSAAPAITPTATTRARLAEQISAISVDDPRRTAVEIEAVIRRYLVERWGLEVGASPGDWQHRLTASGMPEAALDRMGTLADELHYLRYAPQLSQTDLLVEQLKRTAMEWVRRLPRR